MNQKSIGDDSRSAALSIAGQIADGSLDSYPKDKAAAKDRLRAHLEAGDITPEDIKGISGIS